MNITDIFIKRPVLAIVVSALLLVLGLRSIVSLPIQQYPSLESAVITVNTNFIGADPGTIAAFITTPLEYAIAQSDGIDYMTSSSGQNISNIQVNLLLNYDPDKALTQVFTQVNSVLNQLPKNAQIPTLNITVGQSINSMYVGFYSNYLQSNQINDYVLRIAQPKMQAVQGVQQAAILGNSQFALRVWLNPVKLAGYGLSMQKIANLLVANDFVAAAGRTDGKEFILNFVSNTSLTRLNQFKNLIVKHTKNAVVRLKDVAKVTLGAQNYNTQVFFNRKSAIYVGITVAPGANLLTVLDNLKKVVSDIQAQMPSGLSARVVYDASLFVKASIREVNESLLEAFLIVTLVVFLFLADLRSLLIPVIAIPLSIIGTFFIMLVLGYSINLLTLLALVLAIGLVVDDAIIVVENVHRHIEDGVSPLQAAFMSARELTQPIIAITVVLIAVYLPIGFMGGLTGALFTEFAFTLAAAVTVSAVIALSLSPMMCSKMLKAHDPNHRRRFAEWVDRTFHGVIQGYQRLLRKTLSVLPVTLTFAIIILSSNYFLFVTSQTELAPQEDQGVIMSQVVTSANASLGQTTLYTHQVGDIYRKQKSTTNIFEIVGTSGAISAPSLNNAFAGMVLKPWDERDVTTNQLQPELQKEVSETVAGAQVPLFQPPALPGGGSGLPIQMVIQTAAPFSALNEVVQQVLAKAQASGEFMFVNSDLKYDQQQTRIEFDRNKVAEFGLTMQDVGDSLSASLSQNYLNYFDFMGRSYQVIPQMQRHARLNEQDLMNYYVETAAGKPVSFATFTTLKHEVVPEMINHFQQLNSATISAVAAPFVSMGEALNKLKTIAEPLLPQGYTIDYAAQSRQFIEEGGSLVTTFFFALIIIYLALSVLFNSFRDPFIVLISVPMSICGAMIFISMGIGGATLNIYTEVGLVTLIGLISKHGILIVDFANELQKNGKSKLDAIVEAASVRFRPILMTTGAMVLGVVPLVFASGAGAVSRYDIGLVISTGISIGTIFTLFVVPAMYLLIAHTFAPEKTVESDA